MSHLTGINLTIVENSDAFDIFSESKLLTCSPILSCNETNVSITWKRNVNFNGTTTVVNSSMSNGTELMVDTRQYGNYTCTATSSSNSAVTVTYSLYGKMMFNTIAECSQYNRKMI